MQYDVTVCESRIFHSDGYLCRAFPANTLDRSSGDLRSRSASELLRTQKTKLPRLTTVCSGKPDTILQ